MNSVEMSSQEAAWYLLRQPMSRSSRVVEYVPTQWPDERNRSQKRACDMDREGIGADSMDIWTKSKVEHYEERPDNMEDLCLIDFVAWYTQVNRNRRSEDGEGGGYDEDDMDLIGNDSGNGDDGENRPARVQVSEYSKRNVRYVVRYREYDSCDTVNYKRELVSLYVPFRNERVELLDRNKFLELYD